MHTLLGIAFSHYVEKARWALDRFGVAYQFERVLPFFHYAAVYRLHRGKAGRADRVSSRFSTPVLRTPGGSLLCDSADILRYVSATFAPRGEELYPTAEAARLEQHFHDELGPHVRRAAYGVFFERPELLFEVAEKNVGGVQSAAFRASFPLVQRWLKRGLKVDEARVKRSIERIDVQFADVSERVRDGRPFVLGDRLTAADLAFASLAAPCLLPPEYGAWLPPLGAFPEPFQRRAEALRETQAGQLAMRLFRDERRRVIGSGAEAARHTGQLSV